MKFLKYICMTLLLVSAFAFTSVVARAEVVVEECAEAEASVSALPLAAAAFLGIPSAFVFARRRRTIKK
jgi:ABC-type Na+ efflux pump permease subunit